MNKKIQKLIFQGIGLALVIGLAIYLGHIARESEEIRQAVSSYGYAGVLVVAMISGFNLVVPVPAASFMPLFLESGLHYWTTLAIITAGMTIADTVAYFLGNMGRTAVSESTENKFLNKLKKIHNDHKYAPLIILFFFAAFAPLPNEVLLIPFGFLGYKLRHVLPIVFLGNAVFNMLYTKGLTSILDLI